MKEKKIYIAGHRGMVGSAIKRKLEDLGYHNFIFRSSSELDLRDQLQVKEFFKQEKPAIVIDAAAKVGGILANNNYPYQFLMDNMQIQNNLIHESLENKVEKFIFLGSSCIYPKFADQPLKESSLLTDSLEPTNEWYALAKITGVKACQAIRNQFGKDYVSLMPTNLYGPNDNFDLEKSHVLPALIRKIHLGKCLEEGNWEAIRADLDKRPIEGVNGDSPEEEIVNVLSRWGVKIRPLRHKGHGETLSVFVEIWGTGKPMREFLWSEDMADACVFIMELVNFEDLKPLSGEVRNTHLNIGTGIEISIRELAFLVKKVTSFRGDIEFDTSKPDGTLRKLTDPSKLHNLGWSHKIEIEEGIDKLYKWYLSH